MNIFELNHIFVAFAPGAGGNFIAGLLDKINSNNFSDLYISSSGSSHVVNNGKTVGGDSISFGSSPEENSLFSTVEDRETYYLDRISKEYNTPRKIITWTHDFTNLPLYKKHFVNSKSLTITNYEINEKLISTLMHVNKVILSDESDIPIPPELWKRLKAQLKFRISSALETILRQPVDIDHIFDNRCGEYSDLIFYLSSIALLKYIGLYDVLLSLAERIDSPPIARNINIRDLVSTHSDVMLPYSYLINNDVEMLQTAISQVFNRTLSDDENKFIHNTFNAYRAKQDIELLTNPKDYFARRKSKAIATIEKMKAGAL